MSPTKATVREEEVSKSGVWGPLPKAIKPPALRTLLEKKALCFCQQSYSFQGAWENLCFPAQGMAP